MERSVGSKFRPAFDPGRPYISFSGAPKFPGASAPSSKDRTRHRRAAANVSPVFLFKEVFMSAFKVTIHHAGSGTCSLSGKEADGLTVTFDDGTVTEQHLSWKSFRQLVAMKTVQ